MTGLEKVRPPVGSMGEGQPDKIFVVNKRAEQRVVVKSEKRKESDNLPLG